MIQGCSLSLLSVIARLPRKHLGTTLSISGLKWMFIVRRVFSQSADLAALESMADIVRAILLFLIISP